MDELSCVPAALPPGHSASVTRVSHGYSDRRDDYEMRNQMKAQVDARRIEIHDSTLRDGEQAPGNAMNPDQKVELALRLEALGVDCIEVGFPASSPSDFRATQLVSQKLTTARFMTFCRAVRQDVQVAVEAGGLANHQVQLLATGSDLHLEHKRRITRKEAIDEVVDTVRYARSIGLEAVSVGVEDASRGEPELLRPMTEAAIEAGATGFTVADTCGALTRTDTTNSWRSFGSGRRCRCTLPPTATTISACHWPTPSPDCRPVRTRRR